MDGKISPEFNLPTEIYIRQSISRNTAAIVSKFGTRIVIISVISDFEIYQDYLAEIYKNFKNLNLGCIIYDELPANPTTEDIDVAVSFIKKTHCDLILGFGGVESINAAKSIALLISNYVFCYDAIAEKQKLNPPIKLISMPAYPAFGFEISPLFYLKDIHTLTNRVYFNLELYPVASIVDPELSLLMSDDKILQTSASSFALATESVISTLNNDVINTYSLKAIDLLFRNLSAAYNEPKNIIPRVNLSTASVMSGIAFSISYLSVSLAIALAIASKTDIEVETSIALIIPHIMEFNLTTSPGKYVQISRVMGEDVKEITVIEAAIKAVEAVKKMEADINLPQKLSNYKISQNQFESIAEIAHSYPFINNTPRKISKNEIETILLAAY